MNVSIGLYITDVKAAVADFKRHHIIERIWHKDHSVWRPDPTEIINRMGWLTVTDLMWKQIPTLEHFAQEIRDTGFRNILLLGMGGSSLGSEVLQKTFGSAEGYPQLIVLDSTLPVCVRAVTEAIDLPRTLFLVSSKSGSTIETLSLLHYFRSLVESEIGKERAKQNFVAITNPGTPLARKEGFRRIFLNPPDIGGRYSVLSYFGLIPAALIGIDIKKLLSRVNSIRKKCTSNESIYGNPGAWLGIIISILALRGRDKLTFITSPGISNFGLWVEQLIAESTGKDSKGIIPVVGEPLLEPVYYDDDRLFIYMRLKGDDNSTLDSRVKLIKSSGQPILILEMRDKYDLGAEFFRWEFATAIAGAILDINPFDQPNVQMAKDATERVLQEFLTSGRLSQVEVTHSLADLLGEIGKGKYLAIMIYLCQTPEMDEVLADFRRKVVKRYHIATTLGYGPRYLHSTGQLHKGGPNKGLFLQITTDHEIDLPIPGKPYTFGVVVDAQAKGDLQTLQSLGRYVTRVHFGHDYATVISKLTNKLIYQQQ